MNHEAKDLDQLRSQIRDLRRRLRELEALDPAVAADPWTGGAEGPGLQLVDYIPDIAVITTTPDGRLLAVNEAWIRKTGYSREEVLGRTVLELEAWHSQQQRDQYMKAIAHDGEATAMAADFCLKDGSIIPTLISGQVLSIDGEACLLTIFHNITDLKQTEAELMRSEERYRSILQNIEEGYYEVDLAGNLTFFNEGMASILGQDPSTMLGLNNREYMDPRTAHDVYRAFNNVFRTGRPLSNLDWRLIHSDGSLRFVEASVSLIRDSQLRPMGFRGICRDITERRRADESLRQSEEKYRTIAESVMLSITVTELETGRYLEVNKGFCELSGYSKEETLGRTVFDLDLLYDPRDRDAIVNRLRSQGEVKGLPVAYRHRDGRRLETIFSARTIRYHDKSCLLAVVQDITNLREAEKEQARLQARLQHAQKMEAVGTLAGGIAHDFNNILQAISGSAQIILSSDDAGDHVRQYADDIEKAVDRASSLVKRLLTFGRNVEQDYQLVDLNRQVTDAVHILQRTIPKMVSITTDLQPDLRPIMADPHQIEQVVMNLGTNARDAMPEGGRLVIETRNLCIDHPAQAAHPVTAPGDYVLLRVSDTGKGIDPQVMPHIFDPFFTEKEIGEGTGLGLSIVYGIVESCQGHISCQSHPGQGTTFDIYLPASSEDQMPPVREEPLPVGAPGGDERVLLVDDDEAVLRVAGDMLAMHGYRTILATSGEEALATLARETRPVDLVVLDLGMPGMGGQKCLGEMVKLRPDIKVIIASGYSQEGQIARLLSGGAARFLAKPYRFADLLRSIREELDRP